MITQALPSGNRSEVLLAATGKWCSPVCGWVSAGQAWWYFFRASLRGNQLSLFPLSPNGKNAGVAAQIEC